ncbi:MAG: hypothetical protein ACJ8GJ_04825 [Vitreoscilla sp.]
MKKTLCTVLTSSALALCAGFAPPALAAENISVVYTGVATPNTRATPALQAFTDWCNAASGACYPTVQQPVFDTTTGRRRGMVHVWGAFPFNAGTIFPGAICFSEFMVFVLDEGELYTHTAPNGTCGAFMDPLLKPPQHTDLGATAVIAGGGDGVIAGGTNKYKHWSGTFTDRVFVGFGAPTSGVGGIIYYDQLLFVISPDGKSHD